MWATEKRSRSWPIRTVSVQSVAAILVLLAFSGSYITALAAVAWQVHHAAMLWSLLVLLQLTVLICLLSICASETNSLRDSRCFLLFCQAPTSSRRCCCSIHAYIHTHTYIHTYIHYITVHYITLHYMTLHYITLHTYMMCIYIYIYVCIYIHVCLIVRYSPTLGAPPPKSPFMTLGSQFPGKEQPPPPVLN